MTSKDVIMTITACVMLSSGIIMSFLSFFLSMYIIHDSVLWYFAQTILYASSVFGIGSYVHYKIKGITNIEKNEKPTAK